MPGRLSVITSMMEDQAINNSGGCVTLIKSVLSRKTCLPILYKLNTPIIAIYTRLLLEEFSMGRYIIYSSFGLGKTCWLFQLRILWASEPAKNFIWPLKQAVKLFLEPSNSWVQSIGKKYGSSLLQHQNNQSPNWKTMSKLLKHLENQIEWLVWNGQIIRIWHTMHG